jgi:hypothetical protein
MVKLRLTVDQWREGQLRTVSLSPSVLAREPACNAYERIQAPGGSSLFGLTAERKKAPGKDNMQMFM